MENNIIIDNPEINVYLAALDSSNSGIIITDNRLSDNPIIYCNKTFENISGYSRDEIIGHNCRFLQGKDKSQTERYEIKNAIIIGENSKTVIRNYKKNGDLFWNELNISPVRNADNEVTHFIGVQNDITKNKKLINELENERESVNRKIAERTKALQENDNFLRGIIQTVREGLLVLDAEYRIVSVNNHFLRTFKVEYNDTIGKILFEIGNGQWDISALKKLLIQILPTNNPVIDFEVEHDFPHIGKKIMLLNAHRIEFDNEYSDRILIAIEDITERRDIENRKDDFLSVASHELKTPLTTIKGITQLLQRSRHKTIDEKFFDNLDKLSNSVDRLNILISEMLDTSKIQSGYLRSNKKNVIINDIIKESIDQLHPAMRSHRIVYRSDMDFTVHADDLQIQQVLINLISNAAKYSPDSDVIEITSDKVGNFIKVSIKDFGVGINSDDQEKIFKRFYRSTEIEKKFSGLGIGLYISSEIIKNHDGTIWVDSQDTIGSTFNFTLPIYEHFIT